MSFSYLSQFFVIAEHDFTQEADIQNVSHTEIFFHYLVLLFLGTLASQKSPKCKTKKIASLRHSHIYSCFNFMSGFLLHGYTAPRFSEITFASFPMFSADRTQIT